MNVCKSVAVTEYSHELSSCLLSSTKYVRGLHSDVLLNRFHLGKVVEIEIVSILKLFWQNYRIYSFYTIKTWFLCSIINCKSLLREVQIYCMTNSWIYVWILKQENWTVGIDGLQLVFTIPCFVVLGMKRKERIWIPSGVGRFRFFILSVSHTVPDPSNVQTEAWARPFRRQ